MMVALLARKSLRMAIWDYALTGLIMARVHGTDLKIVFYYYSLNFIFCFPRMARIHLRRPTEWEQPEAIIFYFALQDKLSALKPGVEPGPAGEMRMLTGQSAAVHGNFEMKVRPVSGDGWAISELSLHGEPFVEMARVGDLVKSALKLQSDGNFAFSQRPVEEDPNFMALQINVNGILCINKQEIIQKIMVNFQRILLSKYFSNLKKMGERQFSRKVSIKELRISKQISVGPFQFRLINFKRKFIQTKYF